MSTQVDPFAQKLAGATATGFQGKYIQEGDHIMDIHRFQRISGHKGESVVCELTVVEPGHEDHYAGQIASQVFKLAKEISVSNLKALALAVFEAVGVLEDYDAASDDEKVQMLQSLWDGDGTAFAGTRLEVTGVATTTQKGDPFTRVHFTAPE